MKMELEHKNVISNYKKKVALLENQVKELADTNQAQIAAENEDVKILCKRVTELQVKLAEQRELNKKLTGMMENGDADANHNTDKSFNHISHFLETLKQSRNNLSGEEGNFEQIYKLRLSPRDIHPPSTLELLKNKQNTGAGLYKTFKEYQFPFQKSLPSRYPEDHNSKVTIAKLLFPQSSSGAPCTSVYWNSYPLGYLMGPEGQS
ncbi:ecotropic viral integration site 5 ortholog [Caerostris extrusa]|uniref:Ecotropic viral integration site 5 ortholog n=1 Tax=Caerostris extrusa TaxID=172846 RepID=A0AAV4QDY7_CAEEX|nr:ecotropic viral integration site 5 ortholog [Caerostris extrusa]